MPRGDRTGPAGMGPMTGRTAGYCAGHGMPGFTNAATGRGAMGCGAWGRGRGQRNWYYATGLTAWQRAGVGWNADRPTGPWPYPQASGTPYGGFSREQELELLHGQVQGMEEVLKSARGRIAELESCSGVEGETS